MPDGQQLDVVQHPTLGPLKFPKDMPFDERNASIQRQLSIAQQMPKGPTAPPLSMQTVANPLGAAREFGQGLLDVPRGIANIIPALAEPEKTIGEPAQQYWQQTKQQFGQGNPSWIANLVNTILAPTMIPQQTQAFAQTAMENPPRAAGQAAGMYAMGKLPEAPEIMRKGSQGYWDVGKRFLAEGAEKTGAEHAAIINKYLEATDAALAGQKEKIQQARISEPQAFADAEAKHQQRVQTVQQANAESQIGFNQRQQHLAIADQHAQAIADSLPQIHQAARAEASAAYGRQPKGTYDPAEIKNLIEDTARSKLQGNTQLPTAVSKIIKDIEQPPAPTLLDQASVFRGAGKEMRGAGKTISEGMTPEVFRQMDPKWRAAFLERASPETRERMMAPESTAPSAEIDAQRIHGFMSELGPATRSAALKPDEVSAIQATRAMLEGRLRKLYENENRLGDFQAGQAKWKQMANTFENASSPAKGGSPIAQALQTRDPVTGKLRADYVQAALSGDKSFPIAKQMLDRYRHLGAPTNELEVMKTHGDFADTLPSQVKWKATPQGPNYPTFTEWGTLPKTPEPPTWEEFDPVAARKAALKGTGKGLRSMRGIRGALDIAALAHAIVNGPAALTYPILRRVMGVGMERESYTDWLSRTTPEELEMIRDKQSLALQRNIAPSKVSLSKAEIKKLQNRGSP